MPSLLDLSAELQLLIIEYLDTPATLCDPPAAYFTPRASRDVASLSSCCQTLRKLAAPTLYRNMLLKNDDKSGKSLQAVSQSSWPASLVRELNVEAYITLDDEWEEPNPLSDEDLPASVKEVLSHLERFPGLEVLTVQFKCGETEALDEEAVESNPDIWLETPPDPFHDFAGLKQKEELSDWKALMARTYDAISDSKGPGALTTLELRNMLPVGVSTFTTETWRTFLGTLKILRLSLHGREESFNVAYGYLEFIENLDLLFSQLASVTEFRFAATESGLPGVEGHLHTVFPLNIADMPKLQVLELKFCFISERAARFIASHVKTLKRISLEDCYSATTCDNAEEHTSWARFLNMIADSLEAVDKPPLEDFFVSPRILGGGGRELGGCQIGGDDQQAELAQSISRTEPRRRPFDYARVDDKYGFLYEDEEQNLAAFLEGHDQAAFDRVMAIVGRRSSGKQMSV